MEITRLNQNHQPFSVDERGSEYINFLHEKLAIAESLAKEVKQLNPKCLSIGAGYMANMKDIADKFLNK